MLPYISSLKLLPDRPEDNAYANFPLQSTILIVKETVNALLEAKAEVFSSPSHAEHCMCSVGHAFSLPVNSNTLDVMQGAAKLYKRWALDEKKRPKIFSLKEQGFLQTMIRQLSQVFEFSSKGRQLDSDMLAEHVKLCESALNIYAVLASQQERLDQETWKVLMLTVLGISDYLWTSMKNGSEKGLAGAMSERVGTMLFEIWVLSNKEDAALWSWMSKLFPGWCHLMSVVSTWKGACVALTRRMLNLLYGPTEGLPFVRLSIAPKARVDGKFVYYVWSRYLNLLGNLLESTASPETYLEVFVAVRELVNLFLEVGRESVKMKMKTNSTAGMSSGAIVGGDEGVGGKDDGPKGEKNISGVNGNTLLQLFGKFIFDAVISNNPTRHKGTALATQIMCDIFVVCSGNTVFKKAHLARFYTALSRILLSQEAEVSSTLVAVLRYCRSLFTYDLPGSHVLIPAFVFAVSRVLNYQKNVGESIQAADVRNYALTILATLLCVPQHFGSAPLHPISSNVQMKGSEVLGAKSYKDVNQFYEGLISSTVASSANDFQEDNSTNVNLLLWIHFIHGVQRQRFDNILSLCSRILTSTSYAVENTITALKCLSSLTGYSRSHEKLGGKCVRIALDHLNREIRNSREGSAKYVLTASMYTLCDWIMADGKILLESGMLSGVTSAIMRVLTNEAEIKSFRDAARFTLTSIVNNYGQWPSANGNMSLSSALTESNVLTGSNTSRYFCLEGVGFITVVERKDLQDTVTVILRDKKGRWVYNMSLAQIDEAADASSDKKVPEKQPPKVENIDIQRAAAMDASRVVSIYSFFKGKNIHHPLVKGEKESAPQSAAGGKNLPKALVAPGRPESDGSLFRQALSNLGMLSLHQKERFHAVDQTMNFYRDLKQLDLLSERECQRVAVCFVPKGVMTIQGAFMTKHVSAGYMEFVKSLGWGYNVKENRQNISTGGSDDPVFGAEVLPFWANYSSEMIFFPAHMLNCSLDNKIRLLNTAHVAIIYCEDLDGYNPAFFPQTRSHIVINPLASAGLFHTSFVNTKKGGFEAHQYAIGPITDKTVLSRELLAPMVRLTASNAYQSFKPAADFSGRQGKISQMIEKHARRLPPSEFYSLLFKELPSDQLPPPIRLTTREVLSTKSSGGGDASSSEANTPERRISDNVGMLTPPRRESGNDMLSGSTPPKQVSPRPAAEPSKAAASPSVSTPPMPSKMTSPGPPIPSKTASGSIPLPSGTASASRNSITSPGGPPLPGGSPSVKGPPLPGGSPAASSPSGGPPMPGQSRPMKKTIRIAKDGAGRAKRGTLGRGTGPRKGAPPMPGSAPPMPGSGPPMPGSKK